MTTRAFVFAGVGGIAMFIWSFIAHELLPLGEIGIHQLEVDAAVLDALKTNLGDARRISISPDIRRARMQRGRTRATR